MFHQYQVMLYTEKKMFYLEKIHYVGISIKSIVNRSLRFFEIFQLKMD